MEIGDKIEVKKIKNRVVLEEFQVPKYTDNFAFFGC
jgi:hypothetical protein